MTVIRVAFVVFGLLVVTHAARAQAPADSQSAPAGVQASPAPASPAAAPTAPLTAAQIRYNEMLERVKAGDPSVNFAVFRDAFTETPAAFHRNIANGLLRVVMSKGDGATSETAWPVIDISEEYAVMRVLGLSLQKQSLSMKPDGSGPKLDILEVIDQSTKMPRTLYFNVDRSMEATLASVKRQREQQEQQRPK